MCALARDELATGMFDLNFAGSPVRDKLCQHIDNTSAYAMFVFHPNYDRRENSRE